MKKTIFLFCLIALSGLFAGCGILTANNNSTIEVKSQETKSETVLLYSYPKNGIYYYYISAFDIDNFKKPAEVKPANGIYNIFIYDKKISTAQLHHRDRYDIEDDSGYLLDMLSVGVENNPIAYVHRDNDVSGDVQVDVCIFESGNEQIRYLLNPETGKFVKQMRFNNGEIGILNICNPDYVPGQDI